MPATFSIEHEGRLIEVVPDSLWERDRVRLLVDGETVAERKADGKRTTLEGDGFKIVAVMPLWGGSVARAELVRGHRRAGAAEAGARDARRPDRPLRARAPARVRGPARRRRRRPGRGGDHRDHVRTRASCPSIPLPSIDLPSIDLPSIPFPDLPNITVPDWITDDPAEQAVLAADRDRGRARVGRVETPARLPTWIAVELETPHGPARAHLHPATEPRATLVLGHGAGGGVDGARPEGGDAGGAGGERLRRAGRAAVPRRRAASRPRRRRSSTPRGPPSSSNSRSTGFRCSSAAARRARASPAAPPRRPARRRCLCLAFPLHPPGRPEKTRLEELEAVTVPVLIVQGESDPFGMPPEAPGPDGREAARQPRAEVRRAGAARRGAGLPTARGRPRRRLDARTWRARGRGRASARRGSRAACAPPASGERRAGRTVTAHTSRT